MKKSNMKRNLVVMIALMMAMVIFTGCSETALIDESAAAEVSVQSEEKVMDPWEFFGENNLVGKTMAEIEKEEKSLNAISPEDGGVWSGGQWFYTNSEMVIAFPYIEINGGNWQYGEEITDKSIICTGESGTPDGLFGLDPEATMEEVALALELELEESLMDENVYYDTFSYNGKEYCIAIYQYDEITNGHNCTIDITG